MDSIFFSNIKEYYIFRPLSSYLPAIEKLKALVATIALTVFSFGIFPVVCYFKYYKHDYKPLPAGSLPQVTKVFNETVNGGSAAAPAAGAFDSIKHDSDPIDGTKHGITVAEQQEKFFIPTVVEREKIRDATKCAVLAEIGAKRMAGGFEKTIESHVPVSKNFSETLKSDLKESVLYLVEPVPPPHSKHLLCRYDVLVTPCSMDYDFNWKPNDGKEKKFYVAHAAAINIGERANTEDFKTYSREVKGHLRLIGARYVKDMGFLRSTIFKSLETQGINKIVDFPFGMGAFLRNLDKNDDWFSKPEKMWDLRLKLAREYMKQVAAHSKLEIHLCLPMKKEKESNPRLEQQRLSTNQNYNAFIIALAEAAKEVKDRVKVYVNVDASDLAQRLANKDEKSKIGMVNGANAKLLPGNKWFAEGAQFAIDENIVRRSKRLAALGALYSGVAVSERKLNELENRVKNYQGKVVRTTVQRQKTSKRLIAES